MSERAKALVDPVLCRQHDLVTSSQAVDLGIHPETLRRLCRSGHLERIRPRVYRRIGSEPTWEQNLLVVLLGLGPPAVASHRATARLLGIPTYEGAPPEISVPSKRNFRHPEVIVHESRDLGYVPPIVVDGIPDTTLEQVVLDLLIDAGLPLPVCQHVVVLTDGGHFRLDFAYLEVKLAIEVDGPHHRLPEVQARDARRDRRLRALGWEVLRFPEEVVTYRPWLVAGDVHRKLRELGMSPCV